MTPITKEVAAIPPRQRAQVLEGMRGLLRRMWLDRNTEALRDALPHFRALDWLVRFSPYGHACHATNAPTCHGIAD